MLADVGVFVAIISAIGGFIAWVVFQVKSHFSNKIKLEQRIATVEQKLAVNEAKDSNIVKSLEGLREDIKELKSFLKGVEERTRKNEIDIARIPNRD